MFTFVSLVSSTTVLFVIVFDIIVLYSPYSWDFFFLSYEICGLLNCSDIIHGFLSLHTRRDFIVLRSGMDFWEHSCIFA